MLLTALVTVGVFGASTPAALAQSLDTGSAGSSQAPSGAPVVSKVTPDGWVLTTTLTDARVDVVPSLNMNLASREGFGTLDAATAITGIGTVPVDAGVLAVGWQVGCNLDMSSGFGVGSSFGPSATVNISWPPAVSLTNGFTPNITATLKPGQITDLEIASKDLAGPSAGLLTDGVHIKVDGCLGPVGLRPYATATISTATTDATYAVYGRPLNL